MHLEKITLKLPDELQSKLRDDENGNSSASTETDESSVKVKEKKVDKRLKPSKQKNKFETVSESSMPPAPSYSVEDVVDAKWDPADISLLRVLRSNFGNNFCTMTKLLNNKYKCKQVYAVVVRTRFESL